MCSCIPDWVTHRDTPVLTKPQHFKLNHQFLSKRMDPPATLALLGYCADWPLSASLLRKCANNPTASTQAVLFLLDSHSSSLWTALGCPEVKYKGLQKAQEINFTNENPSGWMETPLSQSHLPLSSGVVHLDVILIDDSSLYKSPRPAVPGSSPGSSSASEHWLPAQESLSSPSPATGNLGWDENLSFVSRGGTTRGTFLTLAFSQMGWGKAGCRDAGVGNSWNATDVMIQFCKMRAPLTFSKRSHR